MSSPSGGASTGLQPFVPHLEPINVSASQADSRLPALVTAPGGIVHVIWEEGGRIYHRFCHEGVWSSPRSVATGEQPTITVDAIGIVHVILVNEFGGNYEIYHCRWNGTAWSLPRNVSNTSGVSSAPSLAIAPNGMLHVVWADNTPGYSVIYHAYWDGRYWINEPIPNANGGAPSVAVSSDGIVHVVWQDRDTHTAPYEVYYSRWNMTDWSLPENLSDSAAEQSIIPSVVTDGNNEAHVVWQERVNGRYAIYYTQGRVGAWSIQEQVSNASAEAESYLPCAVVGQGSSLYVGWDESTCVLYRQKLASAVQWSEISTMLNDPAGATDLQLAVDEGGWLHAVWIQRVDVENWDVFYAALSFQLVLPTILKDVLR